MRLTDYLYIQLEKSKNGVRYKLKAGMVIVSIGSNMKVLVSILWRNLSIFDSIYTLLRISAKTLFYYRIKYYI